MSGWNIAIVGRACVLPGALSPEALWAAVRDGRDLTSTLPEGRWRLAPQRVLCSPDAPEPDHSWSDRGGYVHGFEAVWNPEGYAIAAASLTGLDPQLHWLLHCARQALAQTRRERARVGAVFGTLGFPTEAMASYAAGVWSGQVELPDARNRFMAGGSAALLREALALDAGALSLDAACSSALYSLKLACDRLREGSADLMLAGAVQRADDLFLHIGFSALGALSRSGRSRPFHRDADGLLPAEGCALLALKRLEDALRDGDRIYGLIAGIGLSNDGRGRGLLVPDETGQRQAMLQAWAEARLDPASASLLECHATGTQIGDATELRASAAVFASARELPIGSLKSNLGHLITAAGAAGLIKLTEALQAGIRPPTLHAQPATAALAGTPFRLLHAAEPWPGTAPRVAALSAFGFGGNNAHLVLVEHRPQPRSSPRAARPRQDPEPATPIAITGLGLLAGRCAGRAAFGEALFAGEDLRDAQGESPIHAFTLDLEGLRLPPNDLAQTLPQQLAVLEAAREALAETGPLPGPRTAVFVGMEPDPEVARFGARWRSPDGPQREAIVGPLSSAGVLGCMPNIPANRLSALFDFRGPSFTVQCGEASALAALDLACRGLAGGEFDAALVAAVDFGCEPVNRTAVGRPPADAAVVFVLERLADAERLGRRIHARIDVGPGPAAAALPDLSACIGHAGAAQAALRLAAATWCLSHRRRLDGRPWLPAPTPSGEDGRAFAIEAAGLPTRRLRVASGQPLHSETPVARLYLYAAADREALIAAVETGREGGEGPARLALVASPDTLAAQRARALAHVRDAAPAGQGIHFRAQPIGGELAFAFTGAGAAYPGMGRALLERLPQLAEALAMRSARLASALDWAFDRQAAAPSVLDQLWGASALSQLHLELSQGLLGLEPDAWLGYSSGETNALVGAGVWRDPDLLIARMEASGLATRELGGAFAAIARQWGGPVQWASWTVLAPLAEIRAAIEPLPRVHLAIINGETDALIAGDAAQCEAAVERLGRSRCIRLDYPLAVHVPELRAVREAWLELHTLPAHPPRHGRIYSTAWGCSYAPSRERCARAILDQAEQTLDLRPLIRRAWDDGVRVFVEHGPRGAFGRCIRQILGPREALVVSLDRKGQGIEAVLDAVAALWAAGVPVQQRRLAEALRPARGRPRPQRPLEISGHWPALRIGPQSAPPNAGVAEETGPRTQTMAPAPALPSALAALETAGRARSGARSECSSQGGADGLACFAAPAAWRQQLGRIHAVHRDFLARQRAAHEGFLAQRLEAQSVLLSLSSRAGGTPLRVTRTAAPAPAARVTLPQRAPEAPVRSDEKPAAPLFDRAALEIHARGKISTIFGPGFAFQDDYRLQVRMPEPPLLLADRVLAIEGPPGQLGKGRIVTETDVHAEAWYLHHGRMPGGVMIEAGQADLLLVSWQGIDRHNRGHRAYRLLGCELTYHGELPRVGDTLRFDIHLDGHAAQGEVRLMFFHYDCWNAGRKQLSVRDGQAGFFTAQELAESSGCLWSPESQDIVAEPRLDPPEVSALPSALSRARLEAFAAGDAASAFGAGFELARTHTRSPAIHGGRMLLLDRITELSANGGPWGRGYLRAELDIHPEQWFFDGHFKNDPCMPGTLMFEACLQAMAVYLAACGYTLRRDGWRFQPVPELPYRLQCRGQVIPSSRQLITEVFVEERIAGPIPTVYADLLCTVDGLKAFHARRAALELVPDWPLEADPEAGHDASGRPAAVVDGLVFDRRAVLACALGRPSKAFGAMYRRFDGPMRVARLPSPPYLFVSRIAEVHGPMGLMRSGARVLAEYDLPDSAWYFDDNGCRRMPFAVLLEAALQPCGWLSSYVGSTLTVDTELGFRNLDGEGEVLAELGAGEGILRTEVELTEVSASAGMIIESFAVRCWLGSREVYRLRTVFGFFPPEALANQAGLPDDESQAEGLHRPAVPIELAARPETFFAATRPRLPSGMLRMIDRIEGWWPEGGAAGLGQIRTAKTIDPGQWFFKAHFFQDPVQPGSLGLEAMLQSLQAAALLKGLDRDLEEARFESIALGQAHRWKYRGQVLPQHRLVQTTLELTAIEHEAHGVLLRADASLWVDGLRIYEARGLALRIRGRARVPVSE